MAINARLLSSTSDVHQNGRRLVSELGRQDLGVLGVFVEHVAAHV